MLFSVFFPVHFIRQNDPATIFSIVLFGIFSVCSSEQLRKKCAKLSLHARSVADPDLGSGCLFGPWIRDG